MKLTKEQRHTLAIYIRMTAGTRQWEAKAWQRLAEEMTDEGEPRFPHAKDNAAYWIELDEALNGMLGKLEMTEAGL